MSDAITWDKNAAIYEEDIFSVFKSDKKGKINYYVKKNANKNHVAVDYGCGIGYALPILSPLFKKIIGVDISKECLVKAKKLGVKNAQFKKADLADKRLGLKVDFVFCCNVAISGHSQRNYALIKNGLKILKKGGTAVFVIPSVESASLSMQRMVEWCDKEKTKISKIPNDELTYVYNNSKNNILEGIYLIDGRPTKHYSYAELFSLFNSKGFNIEKIDKVEYDWNTEFSSPPKWMKAPYPFDWIIEVKRKS